MNIYTTAHLQTWQQQIESGHAKADAAKVLKLVQDHKGITIFEIAQDLGKSHSTITARLQSLIDVGAVEDRQTTAQFGGQTYTKWFYQPDEQLQEKNRQNQAGKKFQKWIQKGLHKFKDLLDPQVLTQLETLAI